jgi:Tfp pilus assembly protein PilO
LTKDNGRWGDRTAILLAVVFVAILGILEFTIYRPEKKRLKAAEEQLQSLQDQLSGVARRNLADQELFLYAGTDVAGGQFRRSYSAEGGLVYLTHAIEGSGLERQDFKTETNWTDQAFKVERYFLVLRGSYGRILNFMKTLEGGARLVRIDQIRMEQVTGTSDIVVGMRVGVYGLAK